MARQLLERETGSPALVFVTAFDQHAIEAFEVNAVDYLLKPVDAARLEQALARARRRLSVERAGDPVNDQLERLVKMMGNRQIRRDSGGCPGRRPVPPGPGQRNHLCLPGRRVDYHSDWADHRHGQLPDA